MLPKRLLALTLFAALAVMHAGALRAQWVQTNGPYGGAVVSIAVSGSVRYAGTNGNGIYRSTDSGRSWSAVNSGLDGYARTINSLAANDSTVFTATSKGLFVSTDQGASWVNRLNTPGLEGLLLADSNRLFAWSNSSVKLSRNNGLSWQYIFNEYAGFGFLSPLARKAVAVDGNNIYIATNDTGICRSTDYGYSWASSPSSLQIPEISMLFASDGVVVVSGQFTGTYRSTDSGDTWTPSNSGLNNAIPVCLSAIGQSFFLGSYSGLFISSDSGQSWRLDGLLDTTVYSLITYGSDTFAGTMYGFGQRAANSPNWMIADSGIIASSVSALFPLGSQLLGGTYSYGIYSSSDNGSSWNAIPIPVTGNAFATLGPATFAAGAYSVYRSMDSGKTWTNSDTTSSYPYFMDIEAEGSRLFGATETSGIFRSDDTGMSWQPTDDGLPYDSSNQIYTEVYKLAFLGSKIFAATYKGLYFSSDGGESWSLSSFPDSGASAVGVFDGHVVSCAADQVFVSTDSGATWNLATMHYSFSESAAYFVSLIGIGSNLFGASEDDGVWYSSDYGLNWSQANTGLQDSAVTSLSIHGPYLFAGTNYAGVWRRPLSDFAISSVAQTPTVTETDIQIFPNPFPQSTEITFTSPSAGYAEVSIVNLLGMEVAHLFSGEVDAGEHSFSWSKPTGLPDGMYECLVRMNGRVETLPMVLVP